MANINLNNHGHKSNVHITVDVLGDCSLVIRTATLGEAVKSKNIEVEDKKIGEENNFPDLFRHLDDLVEQSCSNCMRSVANEHLERYIKQLKEIFREQSNLPVELDNLNRYLELLNKYDVVEKIIYKLKDVRDSL